MCSASRRVPSGTMGKRVLLHQRLVKGDSYGGKTGHEKEELEAGWRSVDVDRGKKGERRDLLIDRGR